MLALVATVAGAGFLLTTIDTSAGSSQASSGASPTTQASQQPGTIRVPAGWLAKGPPAAEIIAASASAPATAYACVADNGTIDIWRSSDGQTTWQKQPPQPMAGDICTLGVDPTNSLDVVVLVATCHSACQGLNPATIWRSEDGGLTWQTLPLPTATTASAAQAWAGAGHALAAPSALVSQPAITGQIAWVGNNVFILPYYSSTVASGALNAHQLLASTDGAPPQWADSALTDGFNSGFVLQTLFTWGTSLIAVSSHDTSSLTADDGVTWNPLDLSDQGDKISLIASDDNQTLVACLPDPTATSGNCLPVLSTDSVHWTATPPLPAPDASAAMPYAGIDGLHGVDGHQQLALLGPDGTLVISIVVPATAGAASNHWLVLAPRATAWRDMGVLPGALVALQIDRHGHTTGVWAQPATPAPGATALPGPGLIWHAIP